MNKTSQPESTESRYRRCTEQLAARGQDHVLRWWDDLGTSAREHLLSEIDSIPWSHLDPLIETHIRNRPEDEVRANLEPAAVFPHRPDADSAALYRGAVVLGDELIRAGKVAAFTVAGGQGTRLGFEGPKGAVTISPVRDKTLFQLFAETIMAVRKRYDVAIRWYIMTNPVNHRQTAGFLEDHSYFGLPPQDVVLFTQGMLPSFDLNGKILLEDKHRVALAPDGHGGSLKSLVASGALEEMASRGIEIISYFQVDNPLVRPFDPLFIGLHAKTGSEMSTKVATKADDFERVGNLCMHEGRVVVVEYTKFPDDLARAKNPDGSRRFDVGNLAIHLLNVAFVDRIIAQNFELPYRRAEKTVTWMDENGFQRTPPTPNAIKLETFVFDALPLAKNPLLLEVDRAEEFSPVKNAKGVDSVESAICHQIARAARWLEGAGVTIPRKPDGEPDIIIEIAPSYARNAEDVKRRVTNPPELHPGETIYIS
ncbi:MAG: UDPGP type 1 family protein [Phycisphaerales bacterium]|nr:MAG: UDPGP type 1 family protein [Phycisphaerales bacterium]